MFTTMVINGHEVDKIDEHTAIVWSNTTGIGLRLTSDENIEHLLKFFLCVTDVYEYTSRHLEDTAIITLDEVS